MMQPKSPRSLQAKLSAALGQHRAGQLPEAAEIYRQILRADPRHADALHFLGILEHQSGRDELALEMIGRAIALNGKVAAFHNNLGIILSAQFKHAQAAASFRRAVALMPDYVEALYNLGVALQALGHLNEAATAYIQALSYKPDYVEALCNLGNIHLEQGSPDESKACFERALTHRADHAGAQNGLGNVLKQQGKLDAAIVSYREALAYRPDYAEAHCNLGITLLEQGKLEAAAGSLNQALFLQPDYAEGHSHLGNVLKEQGKFDAALVSYRRALEIKPDHAEARLGLAVAAIPVVPASAAMSSGTTEDFVQSLKELADWSAADRGKLGRSVGSTQPFYLAYRPENVRGALSRYGDLICAAATAYWQLDTARGRALQPHAERINLLIVSGQVRRHPVWDVVLRGVLTHLDRRHFKIVLYHTGAMADEETNWARAQVDRFVQGPQSMKAWLDAVKQDSPDVIYYPEVGMDSSTCALAALRLAPVQIAGWGHPVTTGLPSMDMFLSAELLEGPGADQHYREKLVRLPGTGVCTASFDDRSQHWEGPTRPSEVVRFALCQQPIKFDPADDVLLARIAKQAGPCEFWMFSTEKLHWAAALLRNRIAAAFQAEGLDAGDYLHMIPWLPRSEFLGFLDEMDVYLDCPAFSGYTTAWQAVHRGLPIVTLEGAFMRQRLAAGLLRQIGMQDGIASSRVEYVDHAVRLAQECRHQPNRWIARRDAIRRAAPKADGNRSAVEAFAHTVSDAVRARN